MSALGFSDQSNKQIPPKVAAAAGGLIMFFVFLGILALSAAFGLPTDLFSTGYWYDATGIQLVWAKDTLLLSEISRQTLPVNISVEGTIFSIILFLMQIAFGYSMATAGPWLNSRDGDIGIATFLKRAITRDLDAKSVNWLKVWYLVLLVSAALFDTLTDTSWKSAGLTVSLAADRYALMFRAFLISLFYNNLGSEWGIIQGLKMVILHGFMLRKNLQIIHAWVEGEVGGGSRGSAPTAYTPQLVSTEEPRGQQRQGGRHRR